MTSHALPLAQRAAEMRRHFDRNFAEPPRGRQAAPLDLLAIRLGGEPYALRLAAVRGLFTDKKITRLPQAAPEFLGIAGFRGTVVPVYDLGMLLGCTGGEAPRWLVVAADGAVALAFDGFDGQLRVPQEGIAPQAPGEPTRAHTRELVRDAASGSPLRSLIDLNSVIAAIQQRVRRDAPTSRQER